MKNRTLLSTILSLPVAYKMTNLVKPPALCMTEEEEAAMLQKMMHEQGGALADPEEMQDAIRKARGMKNRKPPQFMRLSGPLKMMTMFIPNDGFRFEFGLPFSRSFQTQFSWAFSNKKPAEFEMMAMAASGGGSMMTAEDDVSLVQAQSYSSGRQQIVIQKPLPYGTRLSIEMEMQGADPQQSMAGYTFRKDFGTSHLEYQYQGIHMLNYMQSLSENLHLGYSMTYIPVKHETLFSFAGKWALDSKTTLLGHYHPMHPQEKILCGIVSRPSKKIALFAEVKANPDSKTNFLAGYRAQFSEGVCTGFFTSELKGVAIYKRVVSDMFQLTFTGMNDFGNSSKPVQFGVAMSVGSM